MTRLVWSLAGLCLLIMLAAGLAAGEAKPESNRALEKKVDQILTNQQLILNKLDAMMEELRIVKVRATHS